MITRFPHASFAILDSFFRAIANTGHAMRTICTPDRFILIQTDVIQWAQLHTFSAADTGITYRKSICLDDFLVENGIYRAAHKAVIQIISRCGKFHPIADTVNDTSDSGLCVLDNRLCFLLIRCREQSNIILWHNDLGRAHVGKGFPCGKLPVVLCCIADLAAAIHHEPDAFSAD